ncbi:hypothetical protein NMB32_17445 [Stenotrophomonas sp. CD2]|nr:hypothetical protein NMB32_17445 [Stenotrophomonas sp. CD2]
MKHRAAIGNVDTDLADLGGPYRAWIAASGLGPEGELLIGKEWLMPRKQEGRLIAAHCPVAMGAKDVADEEGVKSVNRHAIPARPDGEVC